MSALQFLREKAGVLVAGVIGLSLLLFVVSDFFGNGQRTEDLSKENTMKSVKLAESTVSYQDYDHKLQNLTEIYKLSGRTNIDEATTESMREQIWQQMIRERILESQYKKLGIGVSAEEVDELVLGNEPHQLLRNCLLTGQLVFSTSRFWLIS